MDLRDLTDVRLSPLPGCGDMLTLRDGRKVALSAPSWFWFDWQRLLRVVAEYTFEQNVDVTQRARKKLVSALITPNGG